MILTSGSLSILLVRIFGCLPIIVLQIYSNCLTIARAPGTDEHPQGLNAFTCRTCPYQFVLDQPYYERTKMKKKEKDDVMGEDVSSLPEVQSMIHCGRLASHADFWSSTMRESGLRLTTCMVLSTADEKCGRTSDFFLQMYQMQQAVEDVLSVRRYLK